MLILFAHTLVEPSARRAFTQWYDAYIPRRLEAAGFLACTRLVRVDNPCETVAIYTIRGEGDWPALLSQNIGERDPALIEVAKHPPPNGIATIATGVYRLAQRRPSEAPFGQGDGCLSIELWDWAEPEKAQQLAHSYDEMYLAHLLDYPDHSAAFRFERFSHPVVEYTNRSAPNLCIVESPVDLAPHDINILPLRADKAALFSNRHVGLYQPVAKYWSRIA